MLDFDSQIFAIALFPILASAVTFISDRKRVR